MSSETGGQPINDLAGCEEIRPLISAYVDDEVTAAEAERVRTHLDICLSCASHLAFLKSLSVASHRLPTAAPSPELFARIAQATYAKPTLRERVIAWLAPSPARWGVAGGLVAAGLAMVLVLRTGTYRAVEPVAAVNPSSKTPTAIEAPNTSAPSAVAKTAPIRPASPAPPAVPNPILNTNPSTTKEIRTAINTAAKNISPESGRFAAKGTARPNVAKPALPTVAPNPRSVVNNAPPTLPVPPTVPTKPRPVDNFAPKTTTEPVSIANNGSERSSASPNAASPRAVATPNPEPSSVAMATHNVEPSAPVPAATEPRERTMVSLKDSNLKAADRPDIIANRDLASRISTKTGVLVEAPVK